MTGPTIPTERLLLRRWKDDDLDAFAAMSADCEVMRFIGDGGTRTREQCARTIRNFELEWDEKGYGLFALELRDSGEFIGFTGLSDPEFPPEVMPAVEIGWRLARAHWGKGYATEAARAALAFGLEDRALPAIVSIFQAGNDGSRRIIENLGMERDRLTIDPTCGRPVEVYRTLEGAE